MAKGLCWKCNVVLAKENCSPSRIAFFGPCNLCRRSGLREEEQRKGREAAAALKNLVYEKFGPVCIRCGFSDKRALQIDHVNGGGSKDYRRRNQTGYFKFVLSNPEKFQILCANCNWIKMHENKEISLHRE